MRKFLLVALALGVSFLGVGQNVNSVGAVKKAQSARTTIDAGIFNSNAPVLKNKSNQKGSISSVAVSSSANVYSYLVETQSVLTSHQSLNLINITHRANPAVIGASSGDIVSSFSKDGGDTWEQILSIPGAAGGYHRYPGAAIYNPTGNTNPDNAYIVTIGPSTDGTNWVSMFCSSHKVDSSNFARDAYPSYGTLPRNGFQSTTDGKFHVITSNYDETTGELDTIRLYEGTWDATNNRVDWVCHKLDANFVLDNAGEEFAFTWNFNTAWSNDGIIGYYWTAGRDSSNDTRSYQPLVWKTTNSGTTWTKMPVYDFSNLSTITDELRYMGGSTDKRPQFSSSMDGVVDANGNLHLICQINSAFSDNDDSLGYFFTQTFEGLPGHNTIFDVYTTNTGWAAHRLGRIWTIDVATDVTPYGDQGWDLRLQAGKSADETRIFASWTDTDTAFAMTNANGFPINSFPDLYVCGINTLNGYRTPATNFTVGTSIAGDAFFHYMSDQIFSSSGTYTIPAMELDLGTTDLDPVYVNYLKGITFVDADFVVNPGFGEKAPNFAFVKQNQPNPFSGNTQIELNLTKSADVALVVTTITGQVVYEMNYGKMSSGVHNLNFNGSNLSSGVYFYTVRANDQSVTNKMIVQ